MTVTIIGCLVAMGAFVGFLAGLLGIGGGMILTPFFTFLLPMAGISDNVVVHVAIATSLGTIVFTSLSSMRAHHKRGAVLWRVVFSVAPGILVGAMMGAKISSLLPTAVIAFIFALFVGLSAIKMFLDAKPNPARELPGLPGMFIAGIAIGLVSSFVGAGGGFISVPLMLYCNVKMQNAVGTSAALGFPIALFGSIGYIWTGLGVAGLPGWPETAGFIHIPALIACACASFLIAPLGAKVAHSIDTKPLKRIFACNLFLIAAYMLYKAFATL